MYLAVIGSADCDERIALQAREVGREIARLGAILVCGGKGGVMEAACQGAKSEGGTTIGILPGMDRREANRYVDIAIVTGLADARNALIVRTADAVIAVSGGHGTLSEIGLALKMGRPVVGLNTWELARHGEPDQAVLEATTPARAVQLAASLAQGTASHGRQPIGSGSEGGRG